MGGFKIKCTIQSSEPTGFGLPGQTIHEINSNIVKPGSEERLKRFFSLTGIVSSFEKTKFHIVKRLDAETDAVESEVLKKGCFVGGHIVGVAFYGHLCIRRDGELAKKPFCQGGQCLIIKKAGRTAAHVQRIK